MTAPPIDIPLDERGAPDLQLLVRLLGSTYLSEPLEHDRHVHRKPSPLWNFGGQIFYEISSAVCLPDYNPQAPFAARPSLAYRLIGDDGLSLCSRGHLAADPRVEQGQPSQLHVVIMAHGERQSRTADRQRRCFTVLTPSLRYAPAGRESAGMGGSSFSPFGCAQSA